MLRFASWMMVIGLLGTVACKDPGLEQRVKDLESKVASMEKGGTAGGAATAAAEARPARPEPTEDDKKAGEMLRDANQAYAEGNWDAAKAKLAELQSTYGTSDAWTKYGNRLSDEINVVGMDAGSLSGPKWFQGSANMDDGKVTMLVFWEQWCPHCRKELPELQKRYAELGGKGFNLVGITKVSGRATDEKVEEFLKENSITFPILKEDGNLSTKFAVSGVPAAALVKDGKVVWRGHPRRVTDDVLAKYM